MNPYAPPLSAPYNSHSLRNFLRLMAAIAVLFVLPSFLVWGYLKVEQNHPMLFQTYVETTRDIQVEQWQNQIDRNDASTLQR